jgi:predicted nucleic acid-binding Zn ribbon protein
MATFEPHKEILACYAALEKREKGCIKRTQSMLDYLSTQEKGNWVASVRRLKADMRSAKKDMPRKNW